MSYYQTIYNRLRQAGITQAGALGVLGNFDCESNCEPYRVQGDFSPYRTASHVYVQGVTNGSISRDTFSRDAKGFGIYQLTYWSRKQGYYDYWKASGKALDDAELQVDYAVKEMASDYPNLLAFLRATTDIFTATSRVCREFERPAVNNIDARYAAAKRIQYEIDLDGWEDPAQPEPEPEPEPEPDRPGKLELRTIDRNCLSFWEIYLLKAALLGHGYAMHFDSVCAWDELLDAAVPDFQERCGLKPDGVVGPKTWAALLKM